MRNYAIQNRAITHNNDNIVQTNGVNVFCQFSLITKMFVVCGEYFGPISIVTVIPLHIL